MISPAATQAMSSPGRMQYWSASAFGRVTWYFEVALAIPYYSKDQILVPGKPPAEESLCTTGHREGSDPKVHTICRLTSRKPGF